MKYLLILLLVGMVGCGDKKPSSSKPKAYYVIVNGDTVYYNGDTIYILDEKNIELGISTDTIVVCDTIPVWTPNKKQTP